MASLSQFATNGGIGQGGVAKAKAAGWTDAQINAAIKSEGLTAGEVIRSQGYGGGSPAPSPSAAQGYIPSTPGGSAQFMGANSTPGHIGLESVNKMRAAGYSDGDIMAQINRDGLKMGEAALASLKKSVDAGSGKEYGFTQHSGTMGNVFVAGPNKISEMLGANSTPGYIGMETVNKLRAQGMSDEWIRHAAGYEGLKFGTVADQSVSKSTWQDNRPVQTEQSSPSKGVEILKNLSTPETILPNPGFGFDSVPTNSEKSPIYTDESQKESDPWNFEYGASKTPAITNDSFMNTNDFAPAPLPEVEKKKSIFEQIMNASPGSSASPQTFASVIANS